MVTSMTSSEVANDTGTGALLTVQQVAARLHGPNFTETDVNRIYRMIKAKQIVSQSMGARKFIPAWQVQKLEYGEDE